MGRRLGILATLAMGFGGCGGTSTGDESSSCPIPNHVGCAQPRGLYEITYNERREGTCGSKAPIKTEAPSVRTTSFDAPCSGSVTWSDDFCVASFEVTCPTEERGPGFTNKQVSTTTYTENGLIGVGVFELSIFDQDGNLFCESTYDKHALNASCEQSE
jgi:hypothetical protein